MMMVKGGGGDHHQINMVWLQEESFLLNFHDALAAQ